MDYSYSRWGPHYSIIAAISSEGLIALDILDGEETFSAAAFLRFLDLKLMPAMNLYNGENTRSVLVMGKLSCLHVLNAISV